MKKTKLIVCMALLLSYTSLAQDTAKITDSLVNACFENAEFTGTVLVAKGGKVLLKKGYGYSDADHQVPNDAHTIYNIASLTKPFTAALIMKLQEAGKLSVQDKLGKYYPDFPQANAITIHHLLTHTSGVFNYTDDPAFRNLDQTKEQTLVQMIGLFKDKPLNFEPGTKFQYSNSGYTLLGYIIEKVTGASYAKALEQYIFKPLGMRHTSYGPPAHANLAKGYMMYYRNFKKPTAAVHPAISYATGAIYSTVEDLYTWHMALQKGQFLSKQSLAAMYTKDKGPYGYGWFTDSLYGQQRISHDGNIPGFKSNINRFPQDNVCIIALSNANNSGVGGMVRNIVNVVYHQPFSKSFADAPVITLPDSLKKEYTGVYKYGQADSARVLVHLQEGDLYVKIPGNQDLKILPVNRNVFRSGSARIEFMRNNKGRIENVLVFNHGEFLGAGKSE